MILKNNFYGVMIEQTFEEGGAMEITKNLDISEKLRILTDAAKYDVACTSSGVDRRNSKSGMGNAESCGICHTFASDGRCVSLLKILFTNECIYDCKYCINRASNDVKRTTFTPDEVCTLTMEFYRRNYIEGLFLSSGIIKSPDYTMSLLYETLYKLRNVYNFYGYIHIKAIPGASPEIIEKIGFLADRMSCNLELPTREGLKALAPNKHHKNILMPIKQIQAGMNSKIEDKSASYKIIPKNGKGFDSKFVPAGQSTQMIIGASKETDLHLMAVTEYMYKQFQMKRVFYSAFVDVNHNIDVPATNFNPLLREHRLYQADWLLRYYGFSVNELLTKKHPNFNAVLDPKCDWAIRHLELFPVDIMWADYYTILRVPGIGVKSAKRIMSARKHGVLNYEALKKMGVVLKRAKYFITIAGKTMEKIHLNQDYLSRALAQVDSRQVYEIENDTTYKQMTIMDLAVKQ